MNITITIDRLQVHAPIGVYDFEKANGNDFEVTVGIDVDLPASEIESDSLESTINYAAVAELVNTTMQQPLNLVEKAALCVANAVMNYGKSAGVAIAKVTVTVAKLRPPIPGLNVQSASATVTV